MDRRGFLGGAIAGAAAYAVAQPSEARGEGGAHKRCVHYGEFPCVQCLANRRWNEAAGVKLTDEQFAAEYCG